MSEFWAVALGVVGCTALLLPLYLRLLVGGGLRGDNYRGESIPLAAGLLPGLVVAMGAALLGVWGRSSAQGLAVGMLGAALIGLLDDAAGDRRATGFGGHFQSLLRGELTTGALKALVIGGLAWISVAGLQRGALWIVADAALIALATNMINLLDVRPGRAVKGTAILLLLAAPALTRHAGMFELWTLVVIGLALIAPFDLRGRAMLGDAGANAFGFAAAWLLVQSGGVVLRGGLLLTLIALHLYSERASLSHAIERIDWLNRFDRWGRPPD